MLFLKVLAFVFLVAGFAFVFAAKIIVNRYKLVEKQKCDFEHEMSEEELTKYKYDKALVNMKMWGLLIALPGVVLIFAVFR